MNIYRYNLINYITEGMLRWISLIRFAFFYTILRKATTKTIFLFAFHFKFTHLKLILTNSKSIKTFIISQSTQRGKKYAWNGVFSGIFFFVFLDFSGQLWYAFKWNIDFPHFNNKIIYFKMFDCLNNTSTVICYFFDNLYFVCLHHQLRWIIEIDLVFCWAFLAMAL